MEQNDILNEFENVEMTESQDEVKEEPVVTVSQDDAIEENDARANADWYALHTNPGYENVAKENLEIVIDKYNLQQRVFDIIIPMEDVVEEKNGKRRVVSQKLMPTYIFVKMIYGDDIWHAITHTRGITGFVGPAGRPIPLTKDEIHKMRLEKVAVVATDLEEGDKVEVLEGALNGFVGTVVSVDAVNNKCRVVVEMFGRETPVDLSLEQVRKVD